MVFFYTEILMNYRGLQNFILGWYLVILRCFFLFFKINHDILFHRIWEKKQFHFPTQNKCNECLISNYIVHMYYIRYTFFLSNHNIHKSFCGLWFWASDPLIEGFEAQKQWPQELFWMLCFDEKISLVLYICFSPKNEGNALY